MKQSWIIVLAVVLAMVVGVRLFVARDVDDAGEAIVGGHAVTARDGVTTAVTGAGVARRPPVKREPPQPGSEQEPPSDSESDGGNQRERASAAVVSGGDSDSGARVGHSGSARPGTNGGAGDVRQPAAAAPADGERQPSGGQSSQAAPRPSAAGGTQAEKAPVLLSIPLKGSVDSEQGDAPTKADGVVIDGEAVEFTADAQYTLPAGGHVDGREGSIAFEIEPRWAGSDETNNSLLQIRDPDNWANTLQIVKNLDTLRFVIVDSLGTQHDVVVDISAWAANEPRRLTATWSETAMTLYVDGEAVGQSPLSNSPKFKTTTPIHVGSDFPGSQFGSANGRISDLTIYGRALAPADVK